jgi:hypothetical protein
MVALFDEAFTNLESGLEIREGLRSTLLVVMRALVHFVSVLS